ncbi:hypothetical protein EDWATA_03861 [Edwardsiella tarda ATCC 23685]|uniref:Uncharacterized protein n=1 Tax=Edwardsiella tarda ATCC 23685 TaxID=500638 RepID=D4FAP0_EDWTA|nr:hypothetical protein EDWATA_03861 [Edwardsiella tarda ATCC 23685]
MVLRRPRRITDDSGLRLCLPYHTPLTESMTLFLLQRSPAPCWIHY